MRCLRYGTYKHINHTSTHHQRSSSSTLEDANRPDDQQYVLPGGGFTVNRGAAHRDPSVYATSKAIIALFGGLSNSDELVERFQGEYGGFTPDPSDDPSQLAKLLGGMANMCDQATLSAELILRLYDACDGEVLLLLSELQGDYSFVLFDSEKRIAVAARNPTGGEPLCYYVDDNGGVVVTNNVDAVASAGGVGLDEELGETQWQVLLLGVCSTFMKSTVSHCVSNYRWCHRAIFWRASACSSLR